MTVRTGLQNIVDEVQLQIGNSTLLSEDNIQSILDKHKKYLKQHQLKYYLKKDKNGAELLIYSKDKEKLNSLVEVLKKYQISATVGLYKEDT